MRTHATTNGEMTRVAKCPFKQVKQDIVVANLYEFLFSVKHKR